MFTRRTAIMIGLVVVGFLATGAAPGAPVYSERVLADNPTAYWRFETDWQEAGAWAVDSVGLDPVTRPGGVNPLFKVNGNAATYTVGTLPDGSPNATYSLNGNTGWYYDSYGPEGNPPGGPGIVVTPAMSFEFWVKAPTSSGVKAILYGSTRYNSTFELALNSGRLYFCLYGTEGNYRQIDGSIDLGEGLGGMNGTGFNHVVVSFDTTADRLQAYVNGVPDPGAAVSGTEGPISFNGTPQQPTFGYLPYLAWFVGIMDEVAIYPYELSAAQVRYHAIPPVTVQGSIDPVGYLGDKTLVGVRFEFRSLTGGDNFTRQIFLNANGTFSLADVPQGRYDIAVRGESFMQLVLGNVTVAANPTVLSPIQLKGADCNGDNTVSFEDFSMLQNNYGQSGAAPANPLAAATGGCGALAIALLACLSLAVHGLKWREQE